MIDYTPSEMIRLELLSYNDPEGLHPIELAWRQLARKLMTHVIESEKTTEEALMKASYKTEEQKKWKPYNFPSPFVASRPERKQE